MSEQPEQTRDPEPDGPSEPAVPVWTCRSCQVVGGPDDLVLDLGPMPAADHFPHPDDPGPDPAYGLSMWCCRRCGLAQLTSDPTTADEPRGVEPAALRQQAGAAVADVEAAGLLDGAGDDPTVAEYGSPHGGTWLDLFTDRGWRVTEGPARVVVDCFGLMHEPDTRAAAAERAARLAPGGVLLLQFHSLEAIVAGGQWNALRHGHHAYFSLASVSALMAGAGLRATHVWEYDLYGGTVLVAFGAADGPGPAPDESLERLLDREAGWTTSEQVRSLQHAADAETAALHAALLRARAGGRRVYGYGAASRAVALLSRAGLGPAELTAVADASGAKQGRALPGSRIPIIAPAELVEADPDQVLLMLPDLLPEVSRAWPELAGRWVTSHELAEPFEADPDEDAGHPDDRA